MGLLRMRSDSMTRMLTLRDASSIANRAFTWHSCLQPADGWRGLGSSGTTDRPHRCTCFTVGAHADGPSQARRQRARRDWGDLASDRLRAARVHHRDIRAAPHLDTDSSSPTNCAGPIPSQRASRRKP